MLLWLKEQLFHLTHCMNHSRVGYFLVIVSSHEWSLTVGVINIYFKIIWGDLSRESIKGGILKKKTQRNHVSIVEGCWIVMIKVTHEDSIISLDPLEGWRKLQCKICYKYWVHSASVVTSQRTSCYKSSVSMTCIIVVTWWCGKWWCNFGK